jgi:hypothetical protein
LFAGLGRLGLLAQLQRRKGLPNFHHHHRTGELEQQRRACCTSEAVPEPPGKAITSTEALNA